MADKKKNATKPSSKESKKKTRKSFHMTPRTDKKRKEKKQKTTNPVVRYFKGAWSEIKRVTWPTRKETIKLTFAVAVYSLAFAAFTSVVDYGFEEAFQRVILGS